MIHGLDTGFLVAAEMREHPQHAAARATLARLIGNGDFVGIAPQVLAEFIHVVTDARRFSQPQDVASARQLAEQWWTARDVVQVSRRFCRELLYHLDSPGRLALDLHVVSSSAVEDVDAGAAEE